MTPTKEALVAALPQDLILDLTAQMVAIPTPNPPGQEKACAEFIIKTLQGWGLETELIPDPDPARPQVVAWWRGAGSGPTIILNGHMDTVGPGDSAAWQVPPFEMTRKGDKIYGLGTCDMKGSLAIGIAILKTLHQSGARLPGTVMFQAAMGEEMDEEGTKTLLKKGYTGDYAIVMEPTDLRVGPGTRGAAWHKITLTGPSVHCGLAAPDTPDLMAHFARVATALANYHKKVAAQQHHLLDSPACRITQVQAGDAHNNIVGRCQFVTDRRMLPHETYEQVTGELRQILEQLKTEAPVFDYQLEFMRGNEPTETPLDSPLVVTLQDNIKQVRGVAPEIWGPPYGSDMRHFVFDAGIPTVNFGAGDFRVCHKPDEFVPVGDLLDCGRIIFGAVIDLLKLPRAGRGPAHVHRGL